jgi:hypothetical protein
MNPALNPALGGPLGGGYRPLNYSYLAWLWLDRYMDIHYIKFKFKLFKFIQF